MPTSLIDRNIAMCLSQKYYTVEDILKQLVKNNSDDDSDLSAYRILCLEKCDQYIGDRHILSYLSSPRYFIVYWALGLDLKAQISKSNKEETIALKFMDIISTMVGSLDVNIYRDNVVSPSISNIQFYLKMRCDKTVMKLMEKKLAFFDSVDFYTSVLNNDNNRIIPLLLSKQKFVEKVIERLDKIKGEDNGYYTKVMVPMYKDMIKSQSTISYDQAKKLHQHLKCFNDNLMNLSQQCYTIYHMPIQKMAYLLGFPIHLYIPGKEALEKALIELNKSGGEKYYDEVQDYYMKTEYNHIFGGRSTFINDKDTLLSDIWTYSPFDRVVFNQNGKNFIFTRPEFPYLLEKRINPHTKVPLSVEFLETVKTRASMAKIYKLGESGPMKDLFEKCGKEDESIPELNNIDTVNNLGSDAPMYTYLSGAAANGVMTFLIGELLGDRY